MSYNQYSACAGCHAKSACTAADKKDKIIEVEDSSGNYQIGDAVVLTGQSSMGDGSCCLGLRMSGYSCIDRCNYRIGDGLERNNGWFTWTLHVDSLLRDIICVA